MNEREREAELARRLCMRDPHAIGDLYDRYRRFVYYAINRVVRNPAAAEDLVQETFLRVWNRASAFEPARAPLPCWIAVIARNLAIDYLRSPEGRLSARAVDLSRMETSRWCSRPDAYARHIDGALRWQQLQAAVKALKPTQKAVIELAYYEGRSQSEMANRLQLPLGTVKTRARLALKHLRSELVQPAGPAPFHASEWRHSELAAGSKVRL